MIFANPKIGACSYRRLVSTVTSLFGFTLFFFLVCQASYAQRRWHAVSRDQLARQAPLPLEDMGHMSWVGREGAPSDIPALAQVKDGYLWIGSRLGLFRFDGLQFSSYPFTSVDPELASSDIRALPQKRSAAKS